jgi:hypothetical protein
MINETLCFGFVRTSGTHVSSKLNKVALRNPLQNSDSVGLMQIAHHKIG